MVGETLFAATLAAVLLGWALLLAAAVMPAERPRRALLMRAGGIWVPVLLCAGHALLLAAALAAGESGSLFSLAGIRELFANPDRLFLLYAEAMAFSLFIGGWIVRDAGAVAAPRLLVVLVLLVQSALGPAGLALWFLRRALVRPAPSE